LAHDRCGKPLQIFQIMRERNFAVNAHDCNAARGFVWSRKCPAELRCTHRCLAALQSCSRHIRKLYDAMSNAGANAPVGNGGKSKNENQLR
jgi:hypothetical protein